MADISLTASMRSNLLSLQNTQSLMDMTQERLSTGKKVNSAIDNPSSYYTAASLNNRASDLNALLASMGQGIQTIKAANEGIEAITAFAQQAKALANTARDEAVKNVEGSVELTVDDTYTGAAADADKITFTVTNIADGTTSEIEFAATEDDTKTETLTALAAALTGDGVKSATVEDGKVKVEGINKVKMHIKPNQSNAKGGIVEEEAFFDVSNVMYVVDGDVTRIGFKVEDGKEKVRYAKKTGAVID